jgi:hypothetical protein
LLGRASLLNGTTHATTLPITSCVQSSYYLVTTLTGHHIALTFVK